MEIFIGDSGVKLTVKEFKEILTKDLLDQVLYVCNEIGPNLLLSDEYELDDEDIEEAMMEIAEALDNQLYGKRSKKPENPEDEKVKQFRNFLEKKKEDQQ